VDDGAAAPRRRCAGLEPGWHGLLESGLNIVLWRRFRGTVTGKVRAKVPV